MKFTIYLDSSSEFRWRLVASNGRTVATSGEGYRNKQDCQSAIKSIQQQAASAQVNDETVMQAGQA